MYTCHKLPRMQKRCLLTCAGLVLYMFQPAVRGEQLQETIQLQESVRNTITITAPAKLGTLLLLSTARTKDSTSLVLAMRSSSKYSMCPNIPVSSRSARTELSTCLGCVPLRGGTTVEELRHFVTKEFSTYVRDPQVFVSPAAYRPIRVYIGGEVARPGYYYLSGPQGIEGLEEATPNMPIGPVGAARGTRAAVTNAGIFSSGGPRIRGVRVNEALRLPTVFDALRTAGGVTPFSNLSEVSVTRKRPLSSGGGKMRTTLDFLSLITKGNESQNIRLFDGDTVVVARSPTELREQIIKAGQQI